MVHEIPDVLAAEIHSNRDARIWSRSGPVTDLRHIEHLLLFGRHRHAINRHQQKVNLMYVELVRFHRVVLGVTRADAASKPNGAPGRLFLNSLMRIISIYVR